MFNVSDNLGNLVPSEIYTYLSSSNLTQSEIASFLGNYLLETAGRRKRVFNYRESFPATDPDCATTFARSFEHEDWIDGESVVQAQETTGELGFNERFHRIEDDIDALAANLATAFVCIREMRGSLEKLLAEIRTELNRINADIFDLQPQTSSPGISVLPGITEAIPWGEMMGITKFLDKEYYVYEMQGNIRMTPVVNPPDELTNPIDRTDMLTGIGMVAKMFTENRDLTEIVNSGRFNKREFVEQFGNVVVGENVTLGDALRTLPDDMQFDSTERLLDELGERAAASVRISSTSGALGSYFGVGRDVGFISDASIRKMNLAPGVTNALEQRGINTVGALARADTREIAAVLERSGLRTTAGDVAGWQATANTLSKIR